METLDSSGKEKRLQVTLRAHVFQLFFQLKIAPNLLQTVGGSVSCSQKSPRIRVHPSSGPCFLSQKLHYQRMFDDA